MKLFKLLSLLFIFYLAPLCVAAEQITSTQSPSFNDTSSHNTESKKKLLFVNSYHKGYLWSDNIEKALMQTLEIKVNDDGSFDVSKSRVQLKIFRMDTKLNQSEAFKKQAALSAKAIIDEWRPDIVVASDDNASKYLIVPYFKQSSIPFVFCGVNWSASEYGFPTSNVTGMVEVAPTRHTISLLKQYAKGSRIGFIGGNTFSERKNINYMQEKENIAFSGGKLVDSFAEWKQEYLNLQSAVDMLLWLNPIGIVDWDDSEAISFILENTRIPTGAASDNEIQYALIGATKLAAEQGIWSGKTALRILDGELPSNIPVARNRHSELYINKKLSKKMGIIFSAELLERASIF